MQSSFDVPLQMILRGIAALIHSHCRYKTGLPITSSYYQKPLICDPFLSYCCCKQVVTTHTCFHLQLALLQQRIIRLVSSRHTSPHIATLCHTTKSLRVFQHPFNNDGYPFAQQVYAIMQLALVYVAVPAGPNIDVVLLQGIKSWHCVFDDFSDMLFC